MKRPFSSVSDFREHACGRILRLADSYLAGELTVESNHEILDHTESCPPCSREVDARGRLRTAVRRIAGELSEPRPGLEAEIRARLSKAPAPAGFRGSPAAFLVAAVLLLGAGLTVFVVRPGRERPGEHSFARGEGVPARGPAAAAFDDAAFDVVAATQLKCADANQWPDTALTAEQLETSLAKEDARFVRLGKQLTANLAGYRLVAAHRCSHGGRLVAHLILKGNRPGLLSLVAFPKTHGKLPNRGPDSIQGIDPAGRPVLLVRSERQGIRVIGAEGERDLFFVSAGRGASDEAQVELGRRLLPFLTTAITAG